MSVDRQRAERRERLTTPIVAGIILGLAGFAGNWFKFTLFLNIDLLFGSFFVMTALLRYGTVSGIVASLVASSATWLFWGHPYAVVIFTAEAAVVGFLTGRRTKSDLPLLDIVYWLCCGAPLVWISYHYLLGDSVSSTVLITVKQALNGITNSLMACIVHLLFSSREKEAERPSLRQLVFIILVSVVLFPACLHAVREFRVMKEAEDRRLAGQTERATDMARVFVVRWLAEQRQLVTSLAARLGAPAEANAVKVRETLRLFQAASPAFRSIAVLDSRKAIVAVTPAASRDGAQPGPMRTALLSLQQDKKGVLPQISLLSPDDGGTGTPIVALAAPIAVAGKTAGYCLALLDTAELRFSLETITGDRRMNITVLNQAGQTVASFGNLHTSLHRYGSAITGTLHPLSATLDQWIPQPSPGKNINQRWAESIFLGRATIRPDSDWSVVVENAYGPVFRELERSASAWLSQLLLLSVVTIPLSSFISFRLTRSLEALQRATISLPDDVMLTVEPQLPGSSIREINGLMANFRGAALALQVQHQTLSGLNRDLEATSRELSLAEERYRTLVEMSPDAVLVLHDDRIVMANRAAQILLGVDPGDLLPGSRFLEHIHPEDRMTFSAQLQRVVRGEAAAVVEVRGVKDNGQAVTMESVGVPVVFNGLPSIQVILRDITGRKQAEALIRKGKEEWEQTFDAIPDLIAILDKQHRVLRINRPMAERLGRSPGECIGLTCHEVIHGTDCPPWFCPHTLTLDDGKLHETNPDEALFGGDYLVTTAPLFDARGEVYASVHMARDISALKQARRRAEESAVELESIFAAIQDAIVIYDRELKVAKVNQVFAATYGFDPLGLHLQDLVRRIDCRRLDGLHVSAEHLPTMRALHGETVRNQKLRITRFDGAEVVLEVSSMPLRLEGQQVAGVVTVWHDITEIIRGQRELREKEERYRSLVEHVPFGIFINRDNRIEYANPATLELFGTNDTSILIGRSPFDFFPPEYHPRMSERISILLAGGRVPMIETRVVRPDGSVRHVEVVATAFVDRHGVAIQVVLHDISRRKQSEDEIRTILERLSLAQRAAGAGLWDWDIPSGTLAWSPELYALFGLRDGDGEASMALWRRAVHPDDRNLAEERITAALQRRERLFSEFRILLPTGEVRWISIVGDTLFDSAGTARRLSGICLDITLRRQAEERLNLLAEIAGTLLVTDSPQRAVETLCLKALEVLDCQLFFNFLADRESGRLHLNACSGIPDEARQQIEWLDYGTAICGCVARDACRIVAENIHESDDPRSELVKSFGAKAYACHPLLMGEEVLGTLSFGSCSRPAFTADELALMKAVANLVAIAMERELSREKLQRSHDILELQVSERTKDLVRSIDSLQKEMAERLRAEEELRTQERLLIQQSRLAAMGEMISNIAHQWRQPLNTLGLIVQRLPYFYDADLLDRDCLATNTRDAMNLIRHMSATIDDFRDFFKPDRDRSVFNVKKAVEQASSLIETGLRSQQIELSIEIEGELSVSGYPSQFSQVILNILLNARDALLERSVANGRIRIAGFREEGRLVLTIRDNAGGMPEAILDKVFDPYFTTKGPDRGTGIGLFMAKSIIEKSMGGTISACNFADGAEFRIEV